MFIPKTLPTRLGAFAVLALFPPTAIAQTASIPSRLLDDLHFRPIGPAVAGGRIHDVEALPNDPSTIYLGAASGGIWKSTNKGTTWTALFQHEAVSTFGDLAIAPSNPNVVWAGTGEQNNRQSTSWGNGVYRSTDAGATWTHLGLEDTRHIGRILVHPSDPDIAYVGALGNLWAPSTERGVFKTQDGGRTWSKVLYVDTLTGVVDMVMDPADPNTVYAATYQRLRRAWGFNGGGPGSGIYKTSDGGRSWRELTGGIPEGDKGRIGLAIARTDPGILNALVEHGTESGTYRTEDGGETWRKVNDLNPRPMYYSHVFIDPTNAQRVYVLAVSFYKSEDGGRNFMELPTRSTYDVGVHSDFHTMWIDPNDPEHFYLAGDGGLHESWDLGRTYIRINNIPIGQFYAIGLDNRDPYYVYGGMQDNHSWLGPSATRHWTGIINDDWRQTGFGDGMYQQADPTSHRYVYVLAQNGSLVRLDAETGDHVALRPYPPTGEADYGFDWVTPSLVSQHDPRVFYLGGNRLFVTRDRGLSWGRTEDLSRGIDRDTLQLMGVPGSASMLSKNDGTSSFGEITTIAESPLDPRILWAGTDDGNVQVSRDGGVTWSEVSGNAPGVRRGTYVSRVAASVTDLGTAYVTFDAHRDGDLAPYVYRTTEFGQRWSSLAGDLPTGSVNVIVEHRENPDLLFLGTEHALYVSTDAGGHWTRFENMPTTLYDDLVIHPRDNDLVVATHGRSLWILDDLTPLAEWSAVASAAHLFSVRDATVFQYWKDTSYRGHAAYAGENPPFGAILTYYLRDDADAAAITISRGDALIRRFDVPGEAGLHRVTWDLRYPAPPTGAFGEGSGGDQEEARLPQPVGDRGPFVSPGRYTITLEVDDVRISQSVTVRPDPLMPLTQDQWEEREAFLVGLLEYQRAVRGLSDSASTLNRRVRTRLTSAGERADAGLRAAADSARALEQRLRRLARSANELAEEFNGNGARQGSLYPPTATQRERKDNLDREWDDAAAALERLRSAAGS